LLFLIYINDLPELCAGEDPSSQIFLYADDSKIYTVIRNQSDQQKLQSILNRIKKTRLTSGFSDEISIKVTVSYCIKHSTDSYHITDRNQLFPLEKVKSMVDFVVRFDSNLTFRDNISGKINNACSVLGIIQRNFILHGRTHF